MQRRSKFILLLSYIFISVFLAIVIWWTGSPICLRNECVKKSKFIMLKMNPKANPCNNFYDFVCGKALQVRNDANTKGRFQQKRKTVNSKNPPDYIDRGANVFRDIEAKTTNYVTNIKTIDLYQPRSLYHENLIGGINKMCRNAKYANDQTGLAHLKSRLLLSLLGTGMSIRDLFNPKKFNQSLTVGIYEYKTRVLGFPGNHYFKAEIKRDHNEPISTNKKAIYIKSGKNSKSIDVSEVKQGSPEKTKLFWVQVFFGIIKSLFPSFETDDTTEESLNKVINLWLDMADIIETSKVMTKGLRDDESIQNNFELVPLNQLQKQFHDLDLKGFFEELIEDKKNMPTHIYMEVESKGYFAALRKVLSKPGHTSHTKVLYMVFHCVLDYMIVMPLSSKVNALIRGVVEKIKGTSYEQCKRYLDLKFTGLLLSLVIERFGIRRPAASSLGIISSHLKEAFRISMEKSSWMDNKTKKEGMEKLKLIKEQISVTDSQFRSIGNDKRKLYFDGLCISETSILTTILCIYEFLSYKELSLFNREISGFDEWDMFNIGMMGYNQEKNKLNVPLYILRDPAFEEKWPWNVNYGMIGTEIGLMLTQGFDEGGSKSDKFGKNNTWWTHKTYKNFNKIESMCSSLSSQAFGIISRKSNNDTNVRSLAMGSLNKDQRMNEKWETVTGVRLGYRAYVAHTKLNKYEESSLPGLEDYNPEQVFFLSHAHMYCPRPSDTNKITSGKKHYFKALMGLKEFKEAFGCKNSDSAVIKAVDKCLLF